MRLAYVVFALIVLLSAIFLISRNARGATGDRTADKMTFDEKYSNLPIDALERRARSNEVMRSEKVPLNEWLPTIESEHEVELPSTEEIAMRAAATLVVALKGQGMPEPKIQALVRQYDLNRWLSPNEIKFINEPHPTERELQTQVWRYEAAKTLLWALGFVERLEGPRILANPDELASLVLNNDRAQFLRKAKLRSKSEILDQADLIYRYRWALVDSRIHNREAPAKLSDDVAMERHQALNWLIEHSEVGWDDISLDT